MMALQDILNQLLKLVNSYAIIMHVKKCGVVLLQNSSVICYPNPTVTSILLHQSEIGGFRTLSNQR